MCPFGITWIFRTINHVDFLLHAQGFRAGHVPPHRFDQTQVLRIPSSTVDLFAVAAVVALLGGKTLFFTLRNEDIDLGMP